jgi:hypothetical protein
MSCYVRLQALFESKGCKLLTAEKDIDKSKGWSKARVSFQARCGHPNEVTVTNFQSKSSGVMCKNCMKHSMSKNLSQKKQNNQDASWSTIQECKVIKKLETILKDNIAFQTTNEGCLSDCIIKPIDMIDDAWLRIQVKTTLHACHNLYSFKLHKNNYKDHIILCHCIDDDKYWLIPHNVISDLKCSLNIGLTTKSAYYKYEVDEKALVQQLLEYYQKTVLYPQYVCMLPSNRCQQIELIYKQRRIDTFPSITFQEPDYTQSYYDFRINDIPVQEKIACKVKQKKDIYMCFLYRSQQKKGYQLYKLGMNKFYWIHIPDTEIFYVIPEGILQQQGYIQGDIEIRRKPQIYLNINKPDAWYQKYKYSISNVDEHKFKVMFEST